MVNIEELQFGAFRAARFYLGGGPAVPEEDEDEEEEDEQEEEEGQEEVPNLPTLARYGHRSHTVT
jgi:hypothetical protein